MELGTYCKALMSHEHFNTLCDEFEAQSAQHMMLTLPNETRVREDVYAEVRGKRAFISLLAEYVASADAILKRDAQGGHPNEEQEIDY